MTATNQLFIPSKTKLDAAVQEAMRQIENGVNNYIVGQPIGLQGAQRLTRYVGGTVSGPPTQGMFLVGDYVVTQNGAIWVCITKGSPGTWLPVGISNPYRAKMIETVAHLHANGSNPAIFDSTEYDPNGNVSGSIYTCPVAGLYRVSGAWQWAITGGVGHGVFLYKNSVLYEWGRYDAAPNANDQPVLPLSVAVPCVAGDTLQMGVYQASGGNLNSAGGATVNYCEFHLEAI